MSIQVIDDFLDIEDSEIIKQSLFRTGNDGYFPWELGEMVSLDNVSSLDKIHFFNFQLSHMFYTQHCPVSDKFSICIPLINKIDPIFIRRIKANLRLYNGLENPEEIEKNYLHNDVTTNPDNPNNIMTGIYYVNTNNGYTLFETGEKVVSIQNRFLKFPCTMRHVGITQTDSSSRIVININFVEKQRLT